MSEPLTPTQKLQEAAAGDLQPVTGAADIAERLLLLLHYSIDWDHSWVKNHLITYWDEEFPSRARTAAYRANTLDGWWSEASTRLGATAPRQPERRLELAQLLRYDDPLAVLNMLCTRLPALVLRVRIIRDANKADGA
ncbi:hypothetical protein [Mycobacteroides abscessus]|uniref:hypothetical protein n=1 Tax=Mycobacteroides abscessus TaxID=36809 RepID=UPI0009A648F2|nr:hypothetical protein [Mycobacteroides abscessus]SLC71262.1 Uncharacterised protein [Mycobacteroides abscessus subsp. massiliense]SLJ48671.1 Uncharacterised protein [Mycobacteroides abscessus subsp. abscessus]